MLPAVAFDETPSFLAVTVPVTVDAAAVDGAETMRAPWASWAKRSLAAGCVAAEAAEASRAKATITGMTSRSMRMRRVPPESGMSGGDALPGPPRRATHTPALLHLKPGTLSGALAQLGGRPGRRADVLRRRPDEPRLALLLEDVGRPTGHARAGEHAREERRRHLGQVEDDGRPELDVGRKDAIGLARLQLGERRALQRLGHLVAGRAELTRRAPQDAGPRILGAVDAVPEAHEALAAVQRVADPALGVAELVHLVEHLEHARGGAAVQRAAQRADRAREGGCDVGARRSDDARGEGRGVHAVLSGRDPVGVDGLGVVGVRLAAPADEEALGGRGAEIDVGLRDRRAPHAAHRLRHEAQRHDRGPGQVVARLLIADVDELPEAPLRRQRRQGALHIDARIARADGERVRNRRRQPRLEAPVDEQAPDLLVGHAADELLDVDAAVAQRAALAVGLGDLGGEGDDALQAGLDFGHVGAHVVASTGSGSGISRARSARAAMRSSSSPSSGRSTAKAASGASARTT